MFEQLFEHRRVQRRHRDGPLAEERSHYLTHLAEQGVPRGALRFCCWYLLAAAKSLRLAERPEEVISCAEVECQGMRWVKRSRKGFKRRGSDKTRKRFVRCVGAWLLFLGRLQAPTPVAQPYADHVTQFTDHQLRERGLSPQTVAFRGRTVQTFLTQIDEAGLRLKTLTVAQVDELLAQKVRHDGYARTTIRTWGSAIRPFFRFAEERGWCRPGMAVAIMTPRVYRHERLPVGPSWGDVNRMLAAAQGDRPADIRDRAVLMLLAVYGVRAGQVVALRLEDFDWQREILTVPPSKSQRPRTYPLCRPVGDAVLRYLREVRPRSHRREVFLTLVPPFRPLQTCRVSDIVSQRLHALGVTLPHYGSHALRHACATHLLAQGLSLKEIGDHLGHKSPETTRIYAKVDLAGLRLVGDVTLEGLL